MPRLFDVTAGSVTLDGTDIRRLEPEALWARIGLVPQKPYLFSGTVGSNLRHARPDATDDELWAALEVAQGRDFVEAMPERLDAPISQGGTNVSGGQRQRLAIARALVRRPAIFLFDDSFSALDLSTDARLRAALRPTLADAVNVVVAQRVSTIIDADQILVLEDGRTMGLGTHAELLAELPDLCRDRRLPAGRGGWHERSEPAQPEKSPAAESRSGIAGSLRGRRDACGEVAGLRRLEPPAAGDAALRNAVG